MPPLGVVPTKRWAIAAAACLLGPAWAGLGGCAASRHAHGLAPVLPAKPFFVDVTINDSRYFFNSPIPSGRVVFRIYNGGSRTHNLVLFPEAPEAPPIDEQLHGPNRRVVDVVAQVFSLSPGQGGTFAIDLVEGQRYGFISKFVGADGRPDFLKGLDAEFVAGRA